MNNLTEIAVLPIEKVHQYLSRKSPNGNELTKAN